MSELIDRQETIKEFCKQDCGCDPKDCPNKTCYEVEIIESVPSVQPQWISCSERLPEIGEYVLCSQDNGDVGEGKLLGSDSWLICYDQTCRGSYWVNAWMPLPEPWKGEE